MRPSFSTSTSSGSMFARLSILKLYWKPAQQEDRALGHGSFFPCRASYAPEQPPASTTILRAMLAASWGSLLLSRSFFMRRTCEVV